MTVAIRSGPLGPALAAVLVVLAGCGSVTQGPRTPRGGTVTPAPVPTDSPTPTPERASVPAPLAAGTPNATALALLQAESLAGRSYRLDTYVGRSRGAGPVGSVQTGLDRRSYRVQSDGNYRAARVVLVVGSGPTSQLPGWTAYADGEAEYRRVSDGNGTSYERRWLAPSALPPHRGRAVAMVGRYLDVAEASVEQVRTERGPRLRVVGRDPQAPGLRNVSDYRVEAVVTGAGRIEVLEATYVAPDGASVRTGFRVRDLGSVRIDPPDWYGEARTETIEGGATPTATAGLRQAPDARPERLRERGPEADRRTGTRGSHSPLA
ncbi:hypothetical protein BRC93_15145 [Halobacteriales archaeon QS_5_70_15]|nr:MAG: hypothetical protein BRC93_15145 [Halobacteriales archaeon QS_5_70_15]